MNDEQQARAQRALSHGDSPGAWLLYDYHQSNPIFAELFGRRATTRRVFVLIGPTGSPETICHHVDAGKFPDWPATCYASRQELVGLLGDRLEGVATVAMEYSPRGELPAVSFVDAGTFELIESLGHRVVSSADIVQAVLAVWTAEEVASHRRAVAKLCRIARRTLEHVAARPGEIDEHGAATLMRQGYAAEGLVAEDGPIVAVNANAGDPHFTPTAEGSAPIRSGDWLLLDFWAREQEGTFADMTWVAYLGETVPDRLADVFRLVAAARDRATARMREAWEQRERLEGWQVDLVARDLIAQAGLGAHFTHRLGHNLGRQVHGPGVNLDNFETRDTRQLGPGIAVTVEPGIYLPDFGVRCEIDVLYGPNGPEVTTPVQREVLRIVGGRVEGIANLA